MAGDKTDEDAANAVELIALKRRRSVYQGLITKCKSMVARGLGDLAINRLQVELAALERNYEQFEHFSIEIAALDDTGSENGEDTRMNDMEETYATLKTLFLEEIEKRNPQQTSSPTEGNMNLSNNLSSLVQHASHGNLPKLDLPSFNGKQPELFIDFINTFDSMIHTNSAFDDVDKFRYLNSCLKEDARKMVAQMEITKENYKIAYEMIRQRYENKALIAESHIAKLFDGAPATNDSAQGVRRLIDDMRAHIRALTSLSSKEKLADAMLIHLALSKLSPTTRLKWEESADKQIPSWDKFESFMEQRASVLEKMHATSKPVSNQTSSGSGSSSKNPRSHPRGNKETALITATKKKCPDCASTDHPIQYCPKFISLEPANRFTRVKALGLCVVCLMKGHQSRDCQAPKCEVCQKSHHTTLHFPVFMNSFKLPKTPEPRAPTTKDTPSMSPVMTVREPDSAAIIGTAIIYLKVDDDRSIPCRALLDSGSSRNFVTKRLAQLLKPKMKAESLMVQGIGKTNIPIDKSCTLNLFSRFGDLIQSGFSCLIIPRMTGCHPNVDLNIDEWEMPTDINLADPSFMKSQRVDVLIGADIFWNILEAGKIVLKNGRPQLRSTRLGWIVVGSTSSSSGIMSLVIDNASSENQDLTSLVERFWRLENIPDSPRQLTDEESRCEVLFARTTTRDVSGRYTVRLPFSRDPAELGDSYNIALRRFQSLENRLRRQPNVYTEYTKFINEYIELGHCEVMFRFDPSKPHAFIPHHCVLKPDSSSTKLRVVFDASCKYSNGLSLNDVLMNGPKISLDLIHILLKWRTFKYAFTADVKKMYRQINIHSDDRDCQMIIWRDPGEAQYKILRLNTVTYGTKPGAYLAVRVLKQLADDDGKDLPLGAEIVRNWTYVDDTYGGANTVTELIEVRDQTRQLLARGGFSLAKFCSNDDDALDDVPAELREKFVEIDNELVIKTLGLIWQPTADEFRFSYKLPATENLTKSDVLSQLARMYDPLGFVCPVVTRGKIIFQQICKTNINWSMELPDDLATQWKEYVTTLTNNIFKLKFARSIYAGEDCSLIDSVELHGFSDASQAAFGCCCYLLVRYKHGRTTSTLLQARSRVTPIKKETMDITRLELEAALLLITMIDDLKRNVLRDMKISTTICWTDSAVAFHWILSEAHEFDIFVKNRIAKIQRLSEGVEWRHIKGDDNPADMISRGVSIEDFIGGQKAWLHGPMFLLWPTSEWPRSVVQVSSKMALPERRKKIETSLIVVASEDVTVNMNFSSTYPGVRRTFAYAIRFIERCKSPILRKPRRKAILGKVKYEDIDLPSITEAEEAEKKFLVSIQKTSFAAEFSAIQRNRPNELSSAMLQLAPWVDTYGNLRVGGRLRKAAIPFEWKHQVLLPSNHRFTRSLLFFLHHYRLFHGGVGLVIQTSRERYWIPNCRREATKIVRSCVLCFRLHPRLAKQLMADLPRPRLTPTTPFLECGVDFMGPFEVRHHRRCKFTAPHYIALFICMSCKCVHLEVVPDLTTEAFIRALMRFIADRGRVKRIHSDNATNFQGTANHLRRLQINLTRDRTVIAEACQRQGVEWSFIPPRSPNFGGLWEASVKLAKGLLKAVIQRSTPSYDEFHTLVRQVGALINSRPITEQSNDPNDLEPLTPGHFLYQAPPSLLPVNFLSHEDGQLITVYQNIVRMMQQYWKRYNTEYFMMCQKRVKDRVLQPNLRVGMMVMLRVDNTPPLYWPIGRIVATYPDDQGVVRVVSVKTSKGEYRRGINNIAPLPFQPFNEELSKAPGAGC